MFVQREGDRRAGEEPRAARARDHPRYRPVAAAAALVTPGTVVVLVEIPLPPGIGVLFVNITARLDAMFYRNTDKTQLALVPIGNSQPIGFRRSETWQQVSDRFVMNQGTHDAVMALAAAAWAAHSGAPVITLLNAINQALQTAGA